MIVCVTIGHAGRPGRLDDRGAVYDGIEEVTLVRGYVDELDRALRQRGHQCIVLSDGHYRDQWARADGYGADVYLNAHVNAGGGDHGLVLHDHRSTRGKALAEAVAGELAETMGWACKVKPCRPDTNGTSRDGDFAEAFGTISGVRAPALCLEPYFIDGPRRWELLGGLAAIGQAIAEGVHRWGASAALKV